MNDIEAISFDVKNGFYDFDRIEEYEQLTIFSGSEDQLIASLTRSATKNGEYRAFPRETLSRKYFPNISVANN